MLYLTYTQITVERGDKMAKRMVWIMVLVMAGTFFLSSCKDDSNPAKVREEKQTLVERQKDMKEVTDFIDKTGEKQEKNTNTGGVATTSADAAQFTAPDSNIGYAIPGNGAPGSASYNPQIGYAGNLNVPNFSLSGN
ncbi:MAG: hypothetical protein NTV77_02460 [Candidatus Azambacteria bacterium]|nr:hypothetical protein [Candidatus Azambacteria bacterium]